MATCFGLPRFFRIESPRISNAVGIVNQPVEDAVGYCRIADLFVPAGTGNCDVRISERT